MPYMAINNNTILPSTCAAWRNNNGATTTNRAIWLTSVLLRTAKRDTWDWQMSFKSRSSLSSTMSLHLRVTVQADFHSFKRLIFVGWQTVFTICNENFLIFTACCVPFSTSVHNAAMVSRCLWRASRRPRRNRICSHMPLFQSPILLCQHTHSDVWREPSFATHHYWHARILCTLCMYNVIHKCAMYACVV